MGVFTCGSHHLLLNNLCQPFGEMGAQFLWVGLEPGLNRAVLCSGEFDGGWLYHEALNRADQYVAAVGAAALVALSGALAALQLGREQAHGLQLTAALLKLLSLESCCIGRLGEH
jgi:hypothetical protein